MTRHLIVCEGRQTEPLYFEGLKGALGERDGGKLSVVVKGSGLHTLDLLDYAEELCRRSPAGFDHAWVAYDKDDFAPEDLDAKFKESLGRGYSKTEADLFPLTKPLLNEAMDAASKLEEHPASLGRKKPSSCNPGTSMQRLFDEIKGYLKQGCP